MWRKFETAPVSSKNSIHIDLVTLNPQIFFLCCRWVRTDLRHREKWEKLPQMSDGDRDRDFWMNADQNKTRDGENTRVNHLDFWSSSWITGSLERRGFLGVHVKNDAWLLHKFLKVSSSNTLSFRYTSGLRLAVKNHQEGCERELWHWFHHDGQHVSTCLHDGIVFVYS